MPLEDSYYGIRTQEAPNLDDEGYLAKLARTVLTPLAWIGSTLDKGGRTVRGLLDGQGPSALLNLVPFSDTAGLTNPDDSPTGRDLLRKWGMADSEDSWGNWLAGLGVDIATDPLNALTFGTKSSLTALGREAAMGLNGARLADTAAGRIAAGQSGLMGLRAPWFIPGMSDARLPLFTGKASENVAAGLGRAGDYLMHEAPVISTPLSKLESMFSYLKGWTGDKRFVQGAAGATDAERSALQAGYQPTVELIGTQRQAIEDLVSKGVPLDQAGAYFSRAVVGAREGGFPESPLLHQIADPTLREQARSNLMGFAGQAAGQLGEGYDAVRQNLRSLGKIIGEDPSLWDLGYFHRQSLDGVLRRGSQQTTRSIPAEVLPGGTNQLNDLIANPTYSGLASKPIPTGMNPTAWADSVENQINRNAEMIAAQAKAHRDFRLSQVDPLTGVSPTMTPAMQAKLTDEAIDKSSQGLARFLADVKPEVVEAGKYFRNDPISSLAEYTGNLSKQAGTAQSALSTLARQATPRDATLSAAKNPNDYVNLTQALSDIGQNAIEKVPGFPSQIEYGGKKSLLEELAKVGKTNAITPGSTQPIEESIVKGVLENKVVPKDLVSVIKKEIEGPGYETKHGFGGLLDTISNAFRTGVTVPFPAYHARNLWEGMLQQGLGGGFSPTAIKDTVSYLTGTIKNPQLAEELHKYAAEAFANGAAFRNQTTSFLGESAVKNPNELLTPYITQGSDKSLLQQMKDTVVNRLKPSKDENYLTTFVQGGIETHNDIENLNRFSQYVGLRRQGYSPQAAKDLTTASQLDYSRLTPAEQKLRQLIPFYSFSKQNLVRLGQQAQDPGAIASLLRAGNSAGDDNYVPSYVSQGASLQLPGTTDEGKTRYLSGFSLPFEDELVGSLGALAKGDVLDAARRGMTAGNPMLKLLATLATGRQIYSGRSLDEVTPSPITSLGGLIPNQTANILSETLSATPIGRVLSTVNAGVAGKDQNLLLKLLTGVKTTDVDQTAATQIAARDAVAHALLSTGMVSTSQNYFPKAEYRDQANQPESLQYLMQLMRLMDQQRKAASEARMMNQPLP